MTRAWTTVSLHVSRKRCHKDDEASCVVFGMPREAIAVGAALHVRLLIQIASRIMEFAQGKLRAAA